MAEDVDHSSRMDPFTAEEYSMDINLKHTKDPNKEKFTSLCK